MDAVNFTRMADGSAEEYRFLDAIEQSFVASTADRVLAQLEQLRGSLGGYRIDRYQHSLQSASRAYRDAASEEMVVAAMLHDIGDTLAPCNHGELAAAVIRPYVSDETYWIIKHHGIFQAYYYAHHLGGDRDARDRYRDHPCYQATVDFCERWDQSSFDPDYETLSIEIFEPMVRRIFARQPFSYDRR